MDFSLTDEQQLIVGANSSLCPKRDCALGGSFDPDAGALDPRDHARLVEKTQKGVFMV